MLEKSLKVNEAKCKVMVLNGEEGSECKVNVDGMQLEHVLNLNTSDLF